MPDGNIYTGEFENGLRSGIGELDFADSSTYCGSFKQDLFHGFGTFVFANK